LPLNVFANDYRKIHEQQKNLKHYSVDAVSGCFLLIDAHLWQALNGFDERFFLYSEEIDLCQRARAMGANPQVINAVQFKHVRGTTSHDFSRMKMLINSKLLYWQKHHGAFKKSYIQLIYAGAYFWRGLLFLCQSKKRKQAKNFLILSRLLLLNQALVDR